MNANHQEPSEPGDRLEQAVTAMKGSPVPPMPAGLMDRTVMRVGAGKPEEGSRRKGWWSMQVVKRSAVAAALVAVVGGGVMLWSGANRVAFADVLQQVKQAHLVRCNLTINKPGTVVDGKQVSMLMSDAGWVETENGPVHLLVDSAAGKMMTLNLDKKEAMLVTFSQDGQQRGAPNLLTVFAGIPQEGSRSLGEKVVDGHRTRGFATHKEQTSLEVWADVKTEKPLLVTMHIENPAIAGATGVDYTFSGFDWAPAVAANTGKFEVPAGFHEERTSWDMSGVAEKDVAEMLRAVARMQGDAFPADIGPGGVAAALEKSMLARTTGKPDAATVRGLQGEMMQKLQPMARAWAFMSNPKNGGEWTYGGNGVKVGEAGKPVLWYRPAGGKSWRVFGADFDIHEAPLPPVGGAPVQMIPAGTAPAGGKR